jgi:predicted transposase
VKLVVQVKLLPDASQKQALRETLALCNRAANLASRRAFDTGITAKQMLQRLVYGEGRCGRIPFACSDAQYATLAAYRKGKSDLVHRDGTWYLYATCDIPDPELYEPDGFLGVDLGIANIATTSDGVRHAGKHLNRVRHRNRALRKKLQKKGTKSARRLLHKRRRKEARFAADTNHRIAKSIVTEAQRTCRGIALENLSGIRERVRLRKPQRVTLPTTRPDPWPPATARSCKLGPSGPRS